MPETELRAGAELAGLRLDMALMQLAGLSRRAARRLCADGCVLLNGHPARQGLSVREGDVITILSAQDRSKENDTAADTQDKETEETAGARCLLRTDDYAFLCKPSLLHSVHLAGRDNASLEDMLPHLVPGCPEARLLQRLDFETSGIVTCALHARAEQAFRAAEHAGEVHKTYLALLTGRLTGPLCMRNALAGQGRRVRALAHEDSDPARSTTIVPLLHLSEDDALTLGCTGPVTLAGCIIHRGYRHQIRVHCAAAGHPLLHDPLYADDTACTGDTCGCSAHADRDFRGAAALHGPCSAGQGHSRHFFLHHARLAFCENCIEDLPRWLARIHGGLKEVQTWFAQKCVVAYSPRENSPS